MQLCIEDILYEIWWDICINQLAFIIPAYKSEKYRGRGRMSSAVIMTQIAGNKMEVGWIGYAQNIQNTKEGNLQAHGSW